jgi:hypothetical protein
VDQESLRWGLCIRLFTPWNKRDWLFHVGVTNAPKNEEERAVVITASQTMALRRSIECENSTQTWEPGNRLLRWHDAFTLIGNHTSPILVNVLVKPITYFIPRSKREEWIGDLCEDLMEISRLYPKPIASIIVIGKLILIVLSALQVSWPFDE